MSEGIPLAADDGLRLAEGARGVQHAEAGSACRDAGPDDAPAERDPHRRYVGIIAAVVLAAFTAMPLFNIVVDPYDVRATLGLAARRPVHPDLETLGFAPNPLGNREGKAYCVRWHRPDAAVFGSSTVHAAMNTLHDRWKDRGLRAFNYGIVGASLFEIDSFVQHTHRLKPLKEILIGLELFMFNVHKPPTPDYPEVPLAHQADYHRRFWLYLWSRWNSFEYTKLSLQRAGLTPPSASPESALVAIADKCWPPASPAATPASATVAPTGPSAAETFHKRLLAMEDNMIDVLYLGMTFPFEFRNANGGSTFDHLQSILDLARRDGVDVRLYISPNHVRTWEIMRLMGLWPRVEEWKRVLVRLLASDAARHPGQPPVPLWDFGGYTSVTVDSRPQGTGPDLKFANHYDSMHFSKEIGDRIMDRVYGLDVPGRPVPSDFGVRLTQANLEEHLARQRAAQRDFARANGAEVRELEAMVRAKQARHR
jgi:hypothetical protein